MTGGLFDRIGEFVGLVLSFVIGGVGQLFDSTGGIVHAFLAGVARGMGVSLPTLTTWLVTGLGVLFLWNAFNALRQHRWTTCAFNACLASFTLGLTGI